MPASSPLWRPALWPVEHSQHLDALGTLEPVGRDEGCAADDQLARSLDAAWSPHLRMLVQHVDLPLDLVVLVSCGKRAVLGEVVELLDAVRLASGSQSMINRRRLGPSQTQRPPAMPPDAWHSPPSQSHSTPTA